MSRVYLDSCVVIYAVEGTTAQQERVHFLLQASPDVERSFVVSDLVRMECRVSPLRAADLTLLGKYDPFFLPPRFEVAPFNRSVFDLAAELRAKFKLKTPDALHVAAARASGCDEFWTNDRRLPVLGSHIRVITVS